MQIEIINAHFSANETKDILQKNNIPFIFNETGGELDENNYQVLININTLNDLMELQQKIGDIIISDDFTRDKTIKMYLLIYDDYLE